MLGNQYEGFLIHISGCVDSYGRLSREARDIVAITNSYTEFDESNTGLNVILKSKCNFISNSIEKGNIEIIFISNCKSITGNIFEGKNTIEENYGELRDIYRKYILERR